jgi:hypothetical protein
MAGEGDSWGKINSAKRRPDAWLFPGPASEKRWKSRKTEESGPFLRTHQHCNDRIRLFYGPFTEPFPGVKED